MGGMSSQPEERHNSAPAAPSGLPWTSVAATRGDRPILRGRGLPCSVEEGPSPKGTCSLCAVARRPLPSSDVVERARTSLSRLSFFLFFLCARVCVCVHAPSACVGTLRSAPNVHRLVSVGSSLVRDCGATIP